jgi:hypothetical protein
VRGVVRKQGRGAYLEVERAKPLWLQDFVSDPSEELRILPPALTTYPGTRLTYAASERV